MLIAFRCLGALHFDDCPGGFWSADAYEIDGELYPEEPGEGWCPDCGREGEYSQSLTWRINNDSAT